MLLILQLHAAVYKRHYRRADLNTQITEQLLQLITKGRLHTLNQMVNQRVNHLVSCWRVAGNPNTRLKLT